MRVSEAARALGVTKHTIIKHIKAGYLSSHFMPAHRGLNAPRYVPVAQVRALGYGKANLRLLDAIAGNSGDWEQRNRLLQSKALKLADARGPKVVINILAEMGEARISDLDEHQQREFNGRMLRAAGYDGRSRTTAWRRRKEAQAARKETRAPEPWELVEQGVQA